MEHALVFAAAAVVALALASSPALADVKLPAIFDDNMVLQQGKPLPVWGTATPGEKVTVTFRDQKKTAVADKDGKWSLKLAKSSAGGPFEMTVSGGNTITFKNVLIGEVWLAGGQSNMQMRLHEVEDAQKEIDSADCPQIRLCTVAHVSSLTPNDNVYADWVECNPRNVPNFSAVAYFFARKLHKDLGVPVGIIHDSWSGSICETWVSREALEALPEVAPLLAAWKEAQDGRGEKEKAIEQRHQESFATWQDEHGKAQPGHRPQAPLADEPFDPLTDFQKPSGNYNGMIAPIIPFCIEGVIWYQGEGNSDRATQFQKLFPTLITDWRKRWGQGDFPFLFVQISSFRQAPSEPYDSDWGQLRDAQLKTLYLPRTGMAVSMDCGDPDQAHFKTKRPVGERLALAAEAVAYGKKVVYEGPMYDSLKVEGGKIRLKFRHADGGLVARNSDDLKTFQIAGADRKWVWATARIDKNSVLVWSDKVADPVAVRYGWMDNALAANLFNGAGLPAPSFRTDDWPTSSENALVWEPLQEYLKNRK